MDFPFTLPYLTGHLGCVPTSRQPSQEITHGTYSRAPSMGREAASDKETTQNSGGGVQRKPNCKEKSTQRKKGLRGRRGPNFTLQRPRSAAACAASARRPCGKGSSSRGRRPGPPRPRRGRGLGNRGEGWAPRGGTKARPNAAASCRSLPLRGNSVGQGGRGDEARSARPEVPAPARAKGVKRGVW